MEHHNEKQAVARVTNIKFDQLPNEIIEIIINSFSPAQLSIWKSVSKNWQKICQTLVSTKINRARLEISNYLENKDEISAIKIIFNAAQQNYLFLMWENTQDSNTNINSKIWHLIKSYLNNYLSLDKERIILLKSLQYACLTKIDLSKFQFTNANLYGANLSQIKSTSSKFLSCDLQKANLSDSDLIKVNFVKTNLSGANLKNTKLTGAKLDNTIFRGANLDNTSFNCDSLICPIGLNSNNLENYFENCRSFSGLLQTLSDYISQRFNILDIEPGSEQYHLIIIKGIKDLLVKFGSDPINFTLLSLNKTDTINKNLNVIINYCRERYLKSNSKSDYEKTLFDIQKIVEIIHTTPSSQKGACPPLISKKNHFVFWNQKHKDNLLQINSLTSDNNQNNQDSNGKHKENKRSSEPNNNAMPVKSESPKHLADSANNPFGSIAGSLKDPHSLANSSGTVSTIKWSGKRDFSDYSDSNMENEENSSVINARIEKKNKKNSENSPECSSQTKTESARKRLDF